MEHAVPKRAVTYSAFMLATHSTDPVFLTRRGWENNTLQVSGTILASGVGIDGDGSTGSGSSGANMVPYVVVNSIIRYA